MRGCAAGFGTRISSMIFLMVAVLLPTLSLRGMSGERGNRSASSPQPSPPFRMEERVAAGRERRLLGNRIGVNARMRRRLRHEDFFDDLPHGRGPSSDPLSARHERGEGKPERLLSPPLSSIPNGGEGGRRPGEEAARQSRRRKCADAPPASARGFLRWAYSSLSVSSTSSLKGRTIFSMNAISGVVSLYFW